MDFIVYVYIEYMDRFAEVDRLMGATLESAWERCSLYFKNNPHDYLIYDQENAQWYVYTTTEYYFEKIV